MPNRHSSSGRPWVWAANAVVIVVLSVFGGYYFYQYQDLKDQSAKSPQQINNELVAEISQFYRLPSSETPDIRTLNAEEVQTLASQEFFADAQAEDKLIVFQEAKQAILYRPSDKQIVNSGPIAVVGQTDPDRLPITVHLYGSPEAIANAESQLATLENTQISRSAAQYQLSQAVTVYNSENAAAQAAQASEILQTLPPTGSAVQLDEQAQAVIDQTIADIVIILAQ